MTPFSPPAPSAQPDDAAPVEEAASGLWPGDTGTLREQSRRAFVHLVRGPYLSAQRHSNLWNALLNDQDAIGSRLADMFLTLVVDTEAQVAFVRNTEVDGLDVPRVVRTAALTFIDTALLLNLRQQLLQSGGSERTIVGRAEVADQMHVYRGRDSADPAGFAKRINASWSKLEKYGILAATSTEGRFEVSPVLRLVFGAQEIAAVQAEYARLAGGADTSSDPDSESSSDDGDVT